MDGITDATGMSLSKCWELVMDREARSAAVHGVAKSWTRLSDSHELNWTLVSEVKVLVAQSCPTLCDPIDCSTPSFLSITNSQSLLKLMSMELVMPSNHLILCCPLLLPSIFSSIKVFSNESVLHIRWPKYWSFNFSISPFNGYSD